jgi:predicted RNA-binding protein associated with RNAse of E/G family
LSVDAGEIRIHYHRPPDREQLFVQQLVAREDDCAVTLLERSPLAAPIRIGGRVALEPDAPAVWFTFVGAWHDIGRFHDATGRFTGIYANVLTPVEGVAGGVWRTTDLFLDVWMPAAAGAPRLLDGDELDAALAAGSVSRALHRRACEEAERILAAAATGEWPPPIVHAWPLERAREAVAQR